MVHLFAQAQINTHLNWNTFDHCCRCVLVMTCHFLSMLCLADRRFMVSKPGYGLHVRLTLTCPKMWLWTWMLVLLYVLCDWPLTRPRCILSTRIKPIGIHSSSPVTVMKASAIENGYMSAPCCLNACNATILCTCSTRLARYYCMSTIS